MWMNVCWELGGKKIAKSPPRQKLWVVLSFSLCHASWGLSPMYPQETWELSHSSEPASVHSTVLANKTNILKRCGFFWCDSKWKGRYILEMFSWVSVWKENNCQLQGEQQGQTPPCKMCFSLFARLEQKKKNITLVWNYANHKHPKYWNPNVEFCQHKHRQVISKSHVNFV